MKGATEGDAEKVTRALQQEAHPNSVADGDPVIVLAAQGGHLGVVEILLDHNSDPNKVSTTSGLNAFDSAMVSHHYDVAAVLFGSCNTEAWTAAKLKAEGHTAAGARQAGFIPDDLLVPEGPEGPEDPEGDGAEAGYDLAELREAGYSLAELSECQGFSVSELGEGGFAPR